MNEMVTIPKVEYLRLKALDEDMSDLHNATAILDRIKAGTEDLIPSNVVDRLLDGDPPLRVWREHRELSQTELARRSGVNRIQLIDIEAGRHPVVENVSSDTFVANDASLNRERKMLIITGPNMGGKSTYMRQTALIVLLALCGSFVPAKRVKLGPIDRIFTRIGSADDLAGGRSTFMVEMTETANILHNATQDSLVLMDEVGRGTSTFDGLSLAWAAAVYIAQRLNAYTLFATHYFELTSLPDDFDSIVNVHLDAVEHDSGIVFMHSVKPGPANQSYGLQVAQLAGIPAAVIDSARGKLAQLEAESLATTSTSQAVTSARLRETAVSSTSSSAEPYQSELFAQTTHPIIETLERINPDDISAKEALALLYELKARLG